MADRVRVGGPAPEYLAVSLQGDTVALEDLRGGPILLNVWATWCGPCRTEIPLLQSLYEENRERGLQIVGVSVDQPGSKNAIANFVWEHEVTYRILHDPRMRVMDAFSVLGLPATFLIDGEGTIRYIHMGPIVEGDETFGEAVEELIS